MAENSTGLLVCDGDAGGINDDDHGCSAVLRADSKVVHFPSPPERNFAVFIDAVMSDSPVVVGLFLARRCLYSRVTNRVGCFP
jgi:hypothetical protein